jgi:hypothetical protein
MNDILNEIILFRRCAYSRFAFHAQSPFWVKVWALETDSPLPSRVQTMWFDL